MIICPHCFEIDSTHASACPSCGRPFASQEAPEPASPRTLFNGLMGGYALLTAVAVREHFAMMYGAVTDLSTPLVLAQLLLMLLPLATLPLVLRHGRDGLWAFAGIQALYAGLYAWDGRTSMAIAVLAIVVTVCLVRRPRPEPSRASEPLDAPHGPLPL